MDRVLLDVSLLVLLGPAPWMREGWTALHSAAEAGKGAAVALLLKKGAFPDARARQGWTPLHVACMRGRAIAAKALVAGGANVNERSADQVERAVRPAPSVMPARSPWLGSFQGCVL